MRLAASAGGDARENLAYVQTLLGNLELARGRLGAAAERLPARRSRGSPATSRRRPAWRARTPRAATSTRRSAATARGHERLPLPEYVVALARGRAARRGPSGGAAREDLALVATVQQRLLRRGGVNIDARWRSFEADHGNPRRAVSLARRAWTPRPRACAPPTRSAGR